ncbi:MAG: hypothetical protein R2909_08140 [Gemmatimonadales bacterium]
MQLAKPALVTSWICQIVAAAILGQTLYFKFTGAPESVYIFSTLNAEPWGRIGSGVLEAIAVVLLLYPKTPAVGAVLALGLMAGAIGAHLTKLGIDVQGDGGTLFALALAVAIASAVVALLRRRELPIVGARF